MQHTTKRFPPEQRNFTQKTNAGFALTLALSLMAFVLILLLSITTLTRVETQGSQMMLAQVQAKQNAQLALQLALGNLQQHTGIDQVATGPAELSDGASPPTQAHWTGAWRRRSGVSTNPLDPSYQAHPVETPVWLVSNDASSPLLPSDTLPTPSANATSTTQWLLKDAVETSEQQVIVPLQEIVGNSDQIGGKFGWWASDQSLQAKITLIDADVVADESSLSPSFIVSQRNGIENFTNDPFSYTPNDTQLTTVFSPDQYQLLTGVSDALASHYHDATTYGYGLAADTLNGGLKRDLTALFFGSNTMVADMLSAGKLVSYEGNRVANYPLQPGQSISNSNWVKSPTWQLLDSFADLSDAIDNSGNISPRVPAEDQHKAGPVLLASSLELTPFKEERLDLGVPTDEYDIRLDLEFTAMLWNPYDVTLAPSDYEIEFFIVENGSSIAAGDTSPIRNTNLSLTQNGGSGLHLPLDEFNTISRIQPEANRYESGIGLVFAAPNVSLEPGEIMLLSIDDSSDETEYNPANGLPTLIEDIAPTRNRVFIKHGNGTGLTEAEIDGEWRIANTNPSNHSSTANIPFLHSAGIRTAGSAIGQIDAYYHQISSVKTINGQITFKVNDSNNPYHQPATDASPSNDDQTYQLHFQYSNNQSKTRSIRWLANYDPTATLASKDSLDLTTDSNASYDYTRDLEGYDFYSRRRSDNLAQKFPTGTAFMPADGELDRVILRDLPDSEQQLLSIAQFQHANLHDHSYGAPFLVGNSDVEVRLPDTAQVARLEGDLPDPNYRNNVDRAWLLNSALYDRFFFSSVTSSGNLESVNHRMLPVNPSSADLRDFEKASSNLYIDGAFNVNSTSVEAWKAILSGRNQLPMDPSTGSSSANELQNPFSRLSHPSATSNLSSMDNKWNGFRELSESQLDDLANAIVDEVIERGPFLSLSDFVNRRIDSDHRVGLNGAIQSAIEQTASINLDFDDINNDNEADDVDPDRIPPNKMILEAAKGNRNENATAWLKQGDVLQAIDAFITNRGDTFTVRTYGNQIDPVKNTIIAEAWCEAVIQRTHEYVDSTNQSHELPYLVSSPDTLNPALSDINQRFGRRYKIVSLRWLTEDEI
ncbi:hypothetical protein QEH59_05065 [Coraliomargarita sp. SDUM461004]|uniref:Flp pilus-assembly TadG-like N-terminal domain-containing protein n=1 Tax=Thalassobacterium sedimentorum TaxID=3041258 RepID=A0ABU1AG19_9BACT|nr:hypothetical protein [Coraliomargarita sp. SDUM461004]MDQ8193781.1 hypothetical protein [Coraliomargarita sp. SDUM461004]